MFKNENKGIVFKARWFVRPDINMGVIIILVWREMTWAMLSSFHLNNGRARVSIRPYKPPRFKNNLYSLFLRREKLPQNYVGVSPTVNTNVFSLAKVQH